MSVNRALIAFAALRWKECEERSGNVRLAVQAHGVRDKWWQHSVRSLRAVDAAVKAIPSEFSPVDLQIRHHGVPASSGRQDRLPRVELPVGVLCGPQNARRIDPRGPSERGLHESKFASEAAASTQLLTSNFLRFRCARSLASSSRRRNMTSYLWSSKQMEKILKCSRFHAI